MFICNDEPALHFPALALCAELGRAVAELGASRSAVPQCSETDAQRD